MKEIVTFKVAFGFTVFPISIHIFHIEIKGTRYFFINLRIYLETLKPFIILAIHPQYFGSWETNLNSMQF